MLSIGALAFLNPWILLGLLSLPILWRILRATPPSPRRLNFPGVRLLLGLEDKERMPDRTPWWLLLLRLSIIAAAILAFAQPVLNPKRQLEGEGPVLIVMDGGWASAPDWDARRGRVLELLGQAERAGRPVALHVLAEPVPPDFRLNPRRAQDWRGRIEALTPAPWAPDRAGFAEAIAGMEGMETIWVHDGIGHDDGALARALAEFGPLTMIGPEARVLALRPPMVRDGALAATAIRAGTEGDRAVRAAAIGRAADGSERRLAVAEAGFSEGSSEAELVFALPLELRNQVSRIAVLTGPSAGGVALADDAVRRKRVGLVSGQTDRDGQPLISHLHYLRQALRPTAEVIEGEITEILEAAPDAMILADVGTFTDAERAALEGWMEEGGLLIRFAGTRMARGESERRLVAEEDPLLPVRLRLGGREVGGAMSWGAPQTVREFPERSPFAGLTAPRDVEITRQVLAQPGPDLTERTIAALSDGTPLVTMAERGQGRVVLFHVTANAEWSSLPLSGLFVQMLERLAVAASVDGAAQLAALEGALWTPVQVLDGYGRLGDAGELSGVPGERLAEMRPGPDAPPGVYQAEERSVAINLMQADSTLAAAPPAPSGVGVEALGRTAETTLKEWLLAAALILLALDVLATLWVSGRMRLPTRASATVALAAGLGLLLAAGAAIAQEAKPGDDRAIAATGDTVLAYVITGDAEVDRISEAGLRGLSRVLLARTAVEPADPIGVDLETDELAFYPMLYWPVTASMETPSDDAYARLNAFTRTGGMIVFDTRDAHLATSFGSGTEEGRALRRLARKLDLPPVEPTPEDHVLTRTFYLLGEFPGRYRGGEVWVEASVAPEEIEGAPFRNLNDGVSPVVIGGHDWAGAWAVSEAGDFLLPVGRDAMRQREMAFRFGVNLVMYVLTGSYKSDQVHVPALLERLGELMDAAIDFSPLLDLPILIGLAGLSLSAVALALLMGAAGWALRGLAALALLAALANPSLREELRDPLTDIAFLVVDESASQKVAERPGQTAEAEADLVAALDALAGGDAPLEYRVVRVASGDGGAADDNAGTQLLSALDAAAAEAAPDRIAGAILLTDGQAHDAARLESFPGPVSALITGAPEEWDRRLVVETAPAFGLVGETVEFSFRIEALGDAPEAARGTARIEIGLDGEARGTHDLPVGRPVTLEVEIEHGGANIVTLNMPALEGELTDRNNGAVLSINGVRDRLRVLLISGEPHAGERTWRNLLKADPSVDLVHFTILRPPEKQDGVPVFELSLISFPTRELFLQKIDEFDLIIFDRYRRRGVLPNAYIDNVARYVREGGAVLVASGPAFAGVESLYRTPLEQVLPGRPTARVLERGYLPEISDLGERHPVTAGLGPRRVEEDAQPWGRWFRLIELEAVSGHTVMTGMEERPLLILDRVEEGRVAALASDHAWLWTRGYEGGGPQAELLRRLAHWLMKEPQLEEEALSATVAGAEVTVDRRSVENTPETLTAIAPSGATVEVDFIEAAPGLWRAGFTAEEQGLYLITDGMIESVAAVGPPAPKEFENPISTTEVLKPLATATKGGAIRLAEAGTPDIRRVREGRPAAGRGWIGLARRDAYTVRDIRLTPLAPGWLMLVLAATLAVGAWRVEGR